MMKLWPFCLAFYKRQNVETLCLNLQNQYGANIGLIIWFCWHASYNRRISQHAYQRALTIIEQPQSTLIEPLRAIRKAELLKAQQDAPLIQKTLLQAELLLEKSVLETLEVGVSALTSHSSAAPIVTLSDYLAELHVQEADTHVRFLYAAGLATIE